MTRGLASFLKIEIFSDVICPWCFIGKRRLDAVIEQGGVGEIELEWRPYQLYPNLPSSGMARDDFLRARYGESADASRTPELIRLEAEEVGITFDYAAIDRVPNTLSAHRLLAMSSELGCQHELAETLFQAYFCDGSDVGDVGTLVNCAVAVGMNGGVVKEFLDSDEGVDTTLREIAGTFDIGVVGVPCYRLGETFLLPGAQTPDVMIQFIDRARNRLAETE